MKHLYVVLLLSLAFFAFSCSENGTDVGAEDKIVIEDTQTSIPTFDGRGGDAQIRFVAKEKWSVQVSATRAVEWCVVSPLQGGPGSVTLNVQVKPNDLSVSRAASITIKSGLDEKIIEIRQEADADEAEIIEFKDEDFKRAITSILGRPSNADVYVDEVVGLTELNLSERNIACMYDLHYFSSLIKLTCKKNRFTDLPLTYEAMQNLKEVDCSENQALERVWVYNKTNVLHSPKITKDPHSHYAILASPNHFTVPRAGADLKLFLRPGIREIRGEDKYDWLELSPEKDAETQDTIYWNLRVRKTEADKLAVLTVESSSDVRDREVEHIYVYVHESCKSPVVYTVLDEKEDGLVQIATAEQHEKLEDNNEGGGGGSDDARYSWIFSHNGQDASSGMFFDNPNLLVFKITCGVLKNEENLIWTIEGDGFYFSENTGVEAKEISVLMDGNPSAKEIYRNIILRAGSKHKTFTIKQSGVHFEILTNGNDDSFDYIPTEDIDDKTIFLPPQKSSEYINVSTNANFLEYEWTAIDGGKYRHDVAPEVEFYSSTSPGYKISYPANYNYTVSDEYFNLFDATHAIDNFKRRGVDFTIRPVIETVDWSTLDIKDSYVYDVQHKIVEESRKVVQMEIIYDHPATYYLAAPLAGLLSTTVSVGTYDENLQALEDQGTWSIKSNVSWTFDDEGAKSNGLTIHHYGQSYYSDGRHLKKANNVYLYLDARNPESNRASGFVGTTAMPFPVVMDLGDGYGMKYPIHPGWLALSGLPEFEVSLVGNPRDGLQEKEGHPNNLVDMHRSKFSWGYYVNVVSRWDKCSKMFRNKAWVAVDAPSNFNHTPDDPWGHVVSDYAEQVAFNSTHFLWWEFELGGKQDVTFDIDAYIDFLDIRGNQASYLYAKHPVSYKTQIESYCDLCRETAGHATTPVAEVEEHISAIEPIVPKRVQMNYSSVPLRYNAKQRSVVGKGCDELPPSFPSRR